MDLYLKADEIKHYSVNIPVQDSYASGTVAVETGIQKEVGSTETPLVTSYQVPHFDDTDLSVYVYVGINGQPPVFATVATIDVVKSAN